MNNYLYSAITYVGHFGAQWKRYALFRAYYGRKIAHKWNIVATYSYAAYW